MSINQSWLYSIWTRVIDNVWNHPKKLKKSWNIYVCIYQGVQEIKVDFKWLKDDQKQHVKPLQTLEVLQYIIQDVQETKIDIKWMKLNNAVTP